MLKSCSTEEVAKSLFHPIKHEIVQQLDIGVDDKAAQGQSTQSHKEQNDKYYLHKLLVSLSGDELYLPVSCGEEVRHH